MGNRTFIGIATRIGQLSLPSRYPDLPGPEPLPTRVMRASAQLLPVAATALSSYPHRVPLEVSDNHAVLAERLQFAFGEDHPVMATGGTSLAKRWPPFHHKLLVLGR